MGNDTTTTADDIGAAIGAALAERDGRIAELEAKVEKLLAAFQPNFWKAKAAA